MTQTDDKKHYRVIRWTGRNVRSLVAFDITPQPQGVTKIVGRNGAGKSSAVDGLFTALGGANAEQALMIRHGQDEMDIEVDCGDFVSRRLVTLGTNELQLRKPDGGKIPRPQEFLSEKIGRTSFDPLAVCRMKPPERRGLLFDVAGITDAIKSLDDDIDATKEKRKKANTTHRDCVGRVRDLDVPAADIPTERVSIADLLTEQRRRQGVEDSNVAVRVELDNAETAHRQARSAVVVAKATLDKAQGALNEAKAAEEVANKAATKQMVRVDALPDPGLDGINQQLADADALNQKIDAATQYRAAAKERDDAKGVVDDYNLHVTALERDKKTLLADAAFPVPGLSFDLDDMCVDGVPFSQLSVSERIRLSFRIAAAMNPELRIIRIEEGAELGADAREQVDTLAREFDFQVLMECMTDDVDGDIDAGTVVIRDGQAMQVGSDGT